MGGRASGLVVCHDKTYRLVIDGFADVQTIRCKVSIASCKTVEIVRVDCIGVE